MNRELLIELGVEELPASWLPPLTRQLAEVTAQQLEAQRLGDRRAARGVRHAAAAGRARVAASPSGSATSKS